MTAAVGDVDRGSYAWAAPVERSRGIAPNLNRRNESRGTLCGNQWDLIEAYRAQWSLYGLGAPMVCKC